MPDKSVLYNVTKASSAPKVGDVIKVDENYKESSHTACHLLNLTGKTSCILNIA